MYILVQSVFVLWSSGIYVTGPLACLCRFAVKLEDKVHLIQVAADFQLPLCSKMFTELSRSEGGGSGGCSLLLQYEILRNWWHLQILAFDIKEIVQYKISSFMDNHKTHKLNVITIWKQKIVNSSYSQNVRPSSLD